MSTHQVFIGPGAIAVALPDEHVVLCHEVLAQASVRSASSLVGTASVFPQTHVRSSIHSSAW